MSRLFEARGTLKLMKKLYTENRTATDELDFCEMKIDDVSKELNVTYDKMWKSVSFDFIKKVAAPKLTPEWKFICTSFYCLQLLNEQMYKERFICPGDYEPLQIYVKNMVNIGISQNLLPNLPFYKPLQKVDLAVEDRFYMLRASLLGFCFTTFRTSLQHYQLFESSSSELLVGLIQLGFCPVRKPSDKEYGSFVMTKDFYDEVIMTQTLCKDIISLIRRHMNVSEFIFSLSKIMKPSNPRWFTEVIVSNLSFSLAQPLGIRSLFNLMRAFRKNESSPQPVTVLGRLVSVTSRTEDFESRILPQIHDLLYNFIEHKEGILLIGEILKQTYKSDMLKGSTILEGLLSPFKQLIRNSGNPPADILPYTLKSGIMVIAYSFVNSMEKLPLELIRNYIGILFNIYMFLEDSNSFLLKDLKNILIEYFNGIDKSQSFQLLENLLFDMQGCEYYSPLYKLHIQEGKRELEISFDQKNIKYDILLCARSIVSLFENESNLENLYFIFLLRCLVDSKKYFPDVSLLVAEDEGYLSTFERKLAVFEVLNLLAGKETVKKYFRENIPEELLSYFNEIFKNAIQTGAHNNPEHDDYQSVFTISMVLQQVFNGKSCSLKCCEFQNTVRQLHDSTNNNELKKLLNHILEEQEIEQSTPTKVDEVEENIQFVLSESIETQGHGLIMLKKMIITKHPQAMERKQFIFTIFKERLVHRDTYIYLAAINGIASFADLGTESTSMVLNTLCEEYRDFPTEEFGPDATEMRLKVGEVLVKVSAKLGEMAPYYKALLLNTFLCGTKDEDHLVRTSALSNLGEICRVLGYKLGSIVTEILVCVNGILNSDKHNEPRRAAVFVIRQLLIGLGKDMLSILKDDILVIYRTLKFLHCNDMDSTVKLQCQLAIQELDNNMKEILMPQIEVNKAEKVVVLS